VSRALEASVFAVAVESFRLSSRKPKVQVRVHFKTVLEYNSSTSTSTKYYISDEDNHH